jgi:3-deoxy-D-manno-octulosonic-acid transferase
MRLLYTFTIYLYYLAIRIASLVNAKAKLWINGRKNIFTRLTNDFKKHKTTAPVIWVHCASLGEFEQGRPLIEKIKKEQPNTIILLTFFSPSGYEIRKNYTGADYVYYLPIDSQTNAKIFIDTVKPQVAIFVKYEFWFNYLNELKTQNIPTYLICGIFRKEHYFFKNYNTWFQKQLSAFSHFYLQDQVSEKLVHSIGYHNTTIAGDTRFDRVFEIFKNVKQFETVKQFVRNKKTLIAGSTWDEDAKILSTFKFKELEFKLIIAPHEIDESTIHKTIQHFSNLRVLKYSDANEQNSATADVLLIDNIGMLSSLYQYGSIAFIGGGFGKGIHNILEAATFGLPVIFGPNYDKFIEAKELIHTGGAFSITSANDFDKTMNLLTKDDVLKMASFASKSYVLSHVGATDKIFNAIFNPKH